MTSEDSTRIPDIVKILNKAIVSSFLDRDWDRKKEEKKEHIKNAWAKPPKQWNDKQSSFFFYLFFLFFSFF